MKFKPESLLTFSILGLIVLAIGGGVWVFFGTPASSPPISSDETGGEIEGVSFSDPQTYEAPEGDDGNNFAFQYPQKFNVTTENLENGGKKILVESTEPKKGFEITILPFDEEGPITADRIRQDIPDMVIENVRNIVIASPAKQSIPALAFNSTDENIGPTFEIWFVHEEKLYQALTYPEFAAGMEEILKTWKFK